jgi:kinesin family protein 18/19
MDSKMLKKKKSSSVSCSKDDENAGAMVVAVRIRPLSSKEINAGQKSCCTAINGNTIAIKKEGNAAMYLKSQQGSVNEYCFDSVFDTSNTQYDVYEKTTKRFIADVVDGYNVTVFAYGATGKPM